MSGSLQLSAGSAKLASFCTDDTGVDEPSCALVVAGWTFVAEASPAPAHCVTAGGDTITGQADNAACQAQAGGYELDLPTSGTSSGALSGSVVVRTGSATLGTCGSVPTTVGRGAATTGGRGAQR